MQAYTAGLGKPKATDILAPPPRSGQVSVYAQKLTALAFVWLCAIVVWGHVTNFAHASGSCAGNCSLQIAIGVIAWVYTSILLVLNYLTESGSMSRTGMFSHGLEVQLIAGLVLIWTPAVGSVSTVGNASPVTVWFAWLGFFGSIYATYKAYHSFKEEDLPTPLPDGYDEDDFVYG